MDLGTIVWLVLLAVALWFFDELVPTTDTNKVVKLVIKFIVIVYMVMIVLAIFGFNLGAFPAPHRIVVH